MYGGVQETLRKEVRIMKPLFVVLIGLFVRFQACGEPGVEDEVSVKRSERKEGNRVVRTTETFFRNGKQILWIVKTLGKQGKWKVTRSYQIEKFTSVCETDEDGDGHFEVLIIFHGEKKSLEAFERLKNGEVLPFPPARLKGLRKQYTQLREFFENTE